MLGECSGCEAEISSLFFTIYKNVLFQGLQEKVPNESSRSPCMTVNAQDLCICELWHRTFFYCFSFFDVIAKSVMHTTSFPYCITQQWQALCQVAVMTDRTNEVQGLCATLHSLTKNCSALGEEWRLSQHRESSGAAYSQQHTPRNDEQLGWCGSLT